MLAALSGRAKLLLEPGNVWVFPFVTHLSASLSPFRYAAGFFRNRFARMIKGSTEIQLRRTVGQRALDKKFIGILYPV